MHVAILSNAFQADNPLIRGGGFCQQKYGIILEVVKHLAYLAYALFLAFFPIARAESGVMSNALELAEINRGTIPIPASSEFEITVQALTSPSPFNHALAVQDKSGATTITLAPELRATRIRIGDSIRLSGIISADSSGNPKIVADKLEWLCSGTVPRPPAVTIPEVLSGRFDFKPVTIAGTVRDVFKDEIDVRFLFLVLRQNSSFIYATAALTADSWHRYESLVGAEVMISGLCDPYQQRNRRHTGRTINLGSPDDIRVVKASNADRFDVPSADSLHGLTPAQIQLHERVRTHGKVVAVWHGDRFLIRTCDGAFTIVEVAFERLPTLGQYVEAVGFPDTDLYHINLSRALWREVGPEKMPDPPLRVVNARTIMTNAEGRPEIDPRMHGQHISLTGSVFKMPNTHDNDIIQMQSDGYTIPIDTSFCPEVRRELSVGCTISASGICVMNIDNFRPNAAFPRIQGFTLIVNTPNAIRLIARPPWWTPERLLTVIGILFGALIVIFAWNRMLQTRAERRGRELAAEQISRAEADFKVFERTRLAVELHDSLAQNLTGIALELKTAAALTREDAEQALTHLHIADKSLLSCRQELRNCMHDLRSDALEMDNMNDAIRLTLEPHANDTDIQIRFNVPRERFSDNTAHAILRIIRELVLNAIHHGHATTIRIAGIIENGRLLVSVKDDGCGFDPNNHPGVRQGHFGLQGIRERIMAFDGELMIESAADEGTKATIAIKLPREDLDNE